MNNSLDIRISYNWKKIYTFCLKIYFKENKKTIKQYIKFFYKWCYSGNQKYIQLDKKHILSVFLMAIHKRFRGK